MLPEIAESFRTGVDVVGLSISTFLLPFAVVMLLAGRLTDRWGAERTLVGGYVVYAVTCIACVVVPHVVPFLAARAMQGVANAFITPVLIAVLATRAAPGRIGRSLGLFGSVQALGQAAAPAVGGVAADADWRLAFLLISAASCALAILATRLFRAQRRDAPREVGALADPTPAPPQRGALVAAATVAALAYATFIGLVVMGALLASDRFGASPSLRGLVVATMGLAGLAVGLPAGRLLDRIGPVRAGALAACLLSCAAVVGACSQHLLVLAGAMAVAGLGGTGIKATTSVLAIRAAGPRRAGATSFVLGCQFLGGAIAPVFWLPLYQAAPTAAMALCASGSAAAGVVLVVSRSRRTAPAVAVP
jgi:MFS family permease